MPGRIALIIPCWRDVEEAIQLGRLFAPHPCISQVILAGVAGFDPGTLEHLIWCEVPAPSRGAQLNAGAAAAHADIFLFHHVDSELTSQHLNAVVAAMANANVIGGGFYRAFDERHPGLRWLENFERRHNLAFGTIYGDQSVFVRAEIFRRLGGFAPIPLMEDVEFSRRLRRAGRIALLDPPMRSSPRRQMAHGAWRVTFRNLAFLIGYRLGVSPHRLHERYYGTKPAQLSGDNERKPVDASLLR